MPTLGDMLRMDENGRFTTSGGGATMSDTLEVSEYGTQEQPKMGNASTHNNSDHTQIRIIDERGKLCGYYEFRQLADVKREYVLTGDVARLKGRIKLKVRLALLRRSFDNPSLTPDQRTKITSEVDRLLSQQPDRPKPEQPRQAISPRPLPNLYVVRDPHGLYMGLFTLGTVQQRWPQSTLHGSVVILRQPALFKEAANSADQPIPSGIFSSDRIIRSLRVAKQFNKTLTKEKPSKYWKSRAHVTYRVFYEGNEPVCQVPYACLAECFDSKWVVISEDSVQLVGDWSPKEVISCAESARTLAGKQYKRVALPGSVSTVDKIAMRQIQEMRQPTTQQPGKSHANNAQKNTQRIIRRVVRDNNGCFMGVYALHEALKIWPDAKLDSSVIVVPRTIEFEQALLSITVTEDFETPFTAQRYRSAIQAASALPSKLLDRNASQFWSSMSDTKLSVFNDMSMPIGRLTPAELNIAYGTNWFLTSLTTAQVMSNLTSSVIQIRCRVTEQRSAKAAALASQEQHPQTSVTKKEAKPQPQKTGQQFKPNVFYVVRQDGKIAYQCQKKKATPVQLYLTRLLPSNSYKHTTTGLQLTQSLESLGFKTPMKFSQMCATVCRGGVPKLTKLSKSSTAKVSVEPSPKPGQKQAIQQQVRPKGETKTTGIVSFDGPEHLLYVSKSALSCERQGHSVEGATGSIVTLSGRTVNINVNYCSNCRRYFIGQREYEHYRDIYGPILGNFSFPGSVQSSSGTVTLSKESPLMMCGYNVRESDGLTSRERQLILANMIDRRILSKPRIIEYLQFFISWREGNPSMGNACDKWREDLAFVRNYEMDTQRRFSIGAVRRYR